MGLPPPKVHRFGWHLQLSEYIVGGWLLQILGVIRAVATAGEPGEIFCHVSYARFDRFPVGHISRNLHTTRRSVSLWKLSEKGVVFPKTCKNLKFFKGLATSGRHNSAMITDRRKFITKITLHGIFSFYFYRWNQFKVIPLACTLRERNLSKLPVTSDAGWKHGR